VSDPITTLATVQRILDEEDLEGLLKMGAPKDEYEPEARRIANAIGHLNAEQLTVDRVAHIVSTVWEDMFGPFHGQAGRKLLPTCRRIAERIVNES